MTAPRHLPPPSPRLTLVVAAAALLAACAEQTPRPAPSTGTSRPPSSTTSTRKPWKPLGPYTPGGLYAPGVSDGAPDVPPDIARLPEPVPHPEPLSHYGNRSPYSVLGKNYTVLPSAAGYDERGMASWYGTKFDGRVTSSFEPYDLTQFTAAHKTLPLPSYARVTNLENGRSVIVRINDRGPFHEGRLIDLSYAAAIKLGVNVHGTAMVEVRGIDTSQPLPASTSDHIAAAPAAQRPAPPKPNPVAPSPAVLALMAPVSAADGADDDATDGDATAAASASAQAATVGDPPSVPAASPAKPDATSDSSAATTAPLPAPPPAATVTSLPAPPVASVPATVASPPAPTPTPLVRSPGVSAPPTAVPPATANAVKPAATPAATPAAAVAIASAATPPPTAAIVSLQPAIAPPAPPLLTGHLPPDPTTRGFLQIASYGDRGRAEHMMQRLQQAGVDHVELVSVQVADQTWWRVHVGPMRADEADKIAAHLDELGFGTPSFFKE